MTKYIYSLSEYNKDNPEPKKRDDNRKHNNDGILSFYHSDEVIKDQVLLDVANYYFRKIGKEEYTLEFENYEGLDSISITKRHNLLKLVNPPNYYCVFKDDDIKDLFVFLNKKCKENYDVGNYVYIRNVVTKIIPNFINNLGDEIKQQQDLINEFNKLYEFDLFTRTIYAGADHPLLSDKIIINKEKIAKVDDLIRLISEDIELYRDVIKIKIERLVRYNNKKNVNFEKIYEEKMTDYIRVINENLSNYRRVFLYEEKYLKFINNFFQNKDLVEVDYKTEVNRQNLVLREIVPVSFINVGFETNSIFINTLDNFIKDGVKEASKMMVIAGEARLNYSNYYPIFNSVDCPELYMDITSKNNVSQIIFRIKEDVLEGLDNKFVEKIKTILKDKILEFYFRERSKNYSEEDKLFLKETLHMISLYKKFNKDSKVEDKQVIKRGKI